MKIISYKDMTAAPVEDPEAKGVGIRVVIGKDEGAENFIMRIFNVVPGGCTPKHTHDWEHEVFILSGKCVVVSEKGEHNVHGGDVVFIPPNEIHQFKNPGPDPLEFICLIPAQTD
jgi:quercetin dioxygenase-like cupin family protein